MKYRDRVIEVKLKKYLDFFSMVGITGPRQSGKSTLLWHMLKDYEYITFDDYRVTNQFYDDPEKFMRIYNDRVVFDEVQLVPEIFNYLKISVDKNREKAGKFVITGSSQFSFVQGIKESLAGRIGLLTLLPYQFSELPKRAQKEAVYRGSYPELVNKNYALEHDWYSSYIGTYLEKDISALAHIGDMRDFQRLINLLAANASQVLNMSRFASDIGVDVKTVKRWISILEASYVIFLLPPFYNNFGKRIIKSPKIYFYDTGLISYLTGIASKQQYEKGPMAGAIFENYIVAEVYKRELHTKSHANLYYLRTSSGEEVDLIIDRKQYCEYIEIKHSETFKPKMLTAVENFKTKNDQAYLVYNGKNLPYLPGIKIQNYKDFLT